MDPARDNDSAEKQQIERRLNDIFDAAEKKDIARLESYHLYGPKFTKFAPEASGRLDAEAARKGERDGLLAVNDLKMRAEELQIDVFGKTAITTFRFNYGFKVGKQTMNKQALATLVFVRTRGAWKITHEHFSEVKPKEGT